MPVRHWTVHWQNTLWRSGAAAVDREPIQHCGGSRFRSRGVSPGDGVYVISMSAGQLLLGGRMTVGRIADDDEALRHFGHADFWRAAEHLIGVVGSGTPLDLHRGLSASLTRRLRFVSRRGSVPPCFVSETELDNQATRGVRELTAESAQLLDDVLRATDGRPTPRAARLVVAEAELGLPPTATPDGTAGGPPPPVVPLTPDAHDEPFGERCGICGFSYTAHYGPAGRDLMRTGGSTGDGDAPLPTCGNCDVILHSRTPAYTPAEVRQLLAVARAADRLTS